MISLLRFAEFVEEYRNHKQFINRFYGKNTYAQQKIYLFPQIYIFELLTMYMYVGGRDNEV